MKSFENIKAVTFDVGGTIITPWPSVGHVYAEVAFASGGKKIPPDELNRRFSAAWRKLNQFNHGRGEWAALVDETFAGLVAEPPSETFFPGLYQRFARADAWQVFPDVIPALDGLASLGIHLAVISNWDERLRPLLDELRLTKYFETIVVSCEVGFPKPSPVIFEHAAKKLGLAPEFILHVGDSGKHDVEGAMAGGFKALQVMRGGHEDADDRVSSLLELERLVT
jgi:putative hydrolase of the HAD superfamily